MTTSFLEAYIKALCKKYLEPKIKEVLEEVKGDKE